MYKRIALIALLLLALCIVPVSATWITAGEFEQTASSVYGEYYASKSSDGNNATFWSAAEFAGWLNWSNPSGYKIDSVRVRTSTGAIGIAYPISTAGAIGPYTAFDSSGFTQINFSVGGIPTNTTGFVMMQYSVARDWSNAAEIQYGVGESIPDPIVLAPPNASYECNFPQGFTLNNPLNAYCWNTSISSPAVSSVEWQLTNPDASIFTTTNASLVRTLTHDGWYGLEFEACNAYGCGYKNTTHLINITSGLIPQTGINFWATTYDPVKNAVIKPSEIYLQNMTSGGWRNISSTGGTVKFTATDSALTELITAGQTVKLCGYAPGYGETCANVTIPYSGWEYKINLAGTSALPIGTNATLFVNAINSYTADGLAATTITIANSTIPYSKSVLSNDAGVATFANIAPGTYTITATKTGYQAGTTNWPAPAGVVTNAYIGLLPAGMTPVVTGTGGENLYDENGNPIIGYDLSGNPITAGPTPDTRTAAEKDDAMMGMLRDQGPMLIQFFIVCFIIYMIMGIGRGR